MSTLTNTPNMAIAPITYQIEHNEPEKEDDPTEDTSTAEVSIGGVRVSELVRLYGTPLYVLDEATIRAMAQAYTHTLKTHYTGTATVLYASKANLTMGLAKLAQQEGLGLDVVSGGELHTALSAGFPPQNILFNGNNKTEDELAMALQAQVGRISVDNTYELELLQRLCVQQDTTAHILLRIAPGIECHTHEYIRTGQHDSKFGFDMAQLSDVVDEIAQLGNESRLTLRGFHAHIGSQIFETHPYDDLIEVMLNVTYHVSQRYPATTYPHMQLTDLNLGGGMGITYTEKDDPPNVATTMQAMLEKLTHYTGQLGLPLPHLFVEPGRSLVATAGVTLYTVGSQKKTQHRHFVAVDGGMGDNIRPALYQAEYTAMLANKPNALKDTVVRVVGKYCESGDILLREVALPEPKAGDTLLVFGTGAYNYAMASNYNRIPRPAMVGVNQGEHFLLTERETYDTLIQGDSIPKHWQ